MGKIKRTRQALHIHAPKCSNTENGSMMQATNNMSESSEMSTIDSSAAFKKVEGFTKLSGGGIFSNIDISPAFLNQKLPDKLDSMSVISFKSTGKSVSKKAKRALKHEMFLQKLEAAKVFEKKRKEKEKRKKTPVVGDMSVLNDALPTLELLMKKGSDSSKDSLPVIKPRASQSFKKQKKSMLEDIAVFQQVLTDPTYVSDPLGTISTHVRCSLQQQKRGFT